MDLINRLKALSSLEKIPEKELKWLIEKGQFGIYETGTIVGPKGKPVDKLWIILSGKVAIRVDRGVGPKLVAVWQAGEVTGMLPYSRMKGPPGDNYIEEKAEVLAIDVKLFSQMIHQCPEFTAYTVHSMIDRVRNFNTSDLQDEKMISLGKLSAGLAHELNNPASATVRGAKQILSDLINMDVVSRALGTAHLTSEQLTRIENIRTASLYESENSSLTPIQRSDYQDQISQWLENRQLDPDCAALLVDMSLRMEDLEDLVKTIPSETLEVVLKWLITSFTIHSLASEIEKTASQVYRVVDAVKKFTYMGAVAEREFVDVEPGIRDTLSILVAKTKNKNAEITLEFAADLPRVYANGGDLNQVWFSLLDNALDAISESGKIDIEAYSEQKRVVVNIVDDGPGIPPDVISNIFDPFFTTKAPGNGTGLGLDISRRLLRRYHGDISVKSLAGRTEFQVSLLVDKPAVVKK
jgi:signal transduction histidine kinase